MKRLMGLDFGAKTTGVALSDPLMMIASPLETITRDKEGKIKPTLRRIIQLAAENEVEKIVLGLPLNMDDSRGERAEKTEGFKLELERRLEAEGLNIPVVLWDERLSTVGADEILKEAEVPRSERKQYIDKIAASLILEDFIKNSREQRKGE
ncbi:MAG: Holliday junction resolvase RuvX [Eubacteriales bacterium]|nr:Holliday junction resolvase RuvX [Eubacteriales bacterium]